MSTITLQHLLDACSPGGASVLTSVTPLEPAAGPHASVAPAKYREGKGKTAKPVFAYERRFWNGEAVTAVLIDSKQSQNNRLEAAVSAAIADEDPVLTRTPRIELRFEDGQVYSDLDLPHRAFDGQIRAGTINGETVAGPPAARAIRDATAASSLARSSVSSRTRTGERRPTSPSAEEHALTLWGCGSIWRTKSARRLLRLRSTSCLRAHVRVLPVRTGRCRPWDLGVSRRRWSSSVVSPARRSFVPMCSSLPRFVLCVSTLRRRKATSPVERC